MLFTKNFFGLILGVFLLQLNLSALYCPLLAQANFFPLGIYNYDVCGGVHTVNETNEMPLIDGIHANYLAEMSLAAQPGMIDTCNQRNGTIVTMLTALSHDDPTGGCYYRVYDHRPDEYNTILWRYISDNNFANIRMDSVIIFINRVYNRYHANHVGIGAIRVAHQGQMDQQDHFAFIRRACGRIQQLFGNAVASMVTHNVHLWNGGTSMADFFYYMRDTLDVYQHEEYPFNVPNAGTDPLHPTASAPFHGWTYQTWHINTLLLGGLDQTRNALLSGQGPNPHTRLEAIIQTQREYEPVTQTFFRRPTESEIWLQAFLALSRGYKGIHTYVYRTDQPGNSWGVIDQRSPRQQHSDSLCYYQNNVNNYNHHPYAVVAQLYEYLSALADDIVPLTVLDAFTWTGTPHSYLIDILDDVDDSSHATIEVSLMDHPSNNYDYLMLVNRRCSSDNSGTPAPAQTITVRTNKSGQYQIRDLYSGELFVSSDGYFRNITIGPGRGRLFELRQMFASNEIWDMDTVNVSSNITVPTGKTLNITANKVKFYSGTELKVQGTLNANGAAFTAAVASTNPGYWSRIYFYYASASSQIQNSTIEKASYGVFCDHASPTIYHNTIESNNYGVYCQSSSHPNITDNYINFNTYGIYCTGTCNPYIRHNDITENDSYGVTCLNSSAPKLVGVNSSNLYGANIVCWNGSYGVLAQTNSNPNPAAT